MVAEISRLGRIFVERFEAEKPGDVEIDRMVVRAMRDALGEIPAYAVMAVIGEDAVCEPRHFAQRITEMLGASADIIFSRLLPDYQAQTSVKVLVKTTSTAERW